jgi:hypothetical protein
LSTFNCDCFFNVNGVDPLNCRRRCKHSTDLRPNMTLSKAQVDRRPALQRLRGSLRTNVDPTLSRARRVLASCKMPRTARVAARDRLSAIIGPAQLGNDPLTCTTRGAGPRTTAALVYGHDSLATIV